MVVGGMISPASLFSSDWSSSDTLRKTSSRVVSITPKLVRARLSKLFSNAWSHTTKDNVKLLSSVPVTSNTSNALQGWQIRPDLYHD